MRNAQTETSPFPAVHSLYPAFFFLFFLSKKKKSCICGPLLCDTEAENDMLLWKELCAFSVMGMAVWDLVNHFLLLCVAGSGWSLHYRSSIAYFQFFSAVLVFIICNR